MSGEIAFGRRPNRHRLAPYRVARDRSTPFDLRRPAQRSPTRLKPFRRRADRERFAVDALVYLAPRQRRRHARVLAGARAVRGRQRLAGDVLQVVDVDALAAHSSPSVRRWPVSDASARRPSRRSDRRAGRLRTAFPAAGEYRCAALRRLRSSESRPRRAISSSSRIHRATSSTCENGTSGIGSRSSAT